MQSFTRPLPASTQTDCVDEAYIRVIVESAGRTTLMLSVRDAFPAGFKSCLPEHVREFADLIESPKSFDPPKARPSKRQIDELDMVQDWMVYLARHCHDRKIGYVARLFAMAILHYPRSGRRVYSFRKLGDIFGVSNHTAKKWYMDALRIIASYYNLERAVYQNEEAFTPHVSGMFFTRT